MSEENRQLATISGRAEAAAATLSTLNQRRAMESEDRTVEDRTIGELVDLTPYAKSGEMIGPAFRYPIVCTEGVWTELNDIPPLLSYQNLSSRIQTLLFAALLAILRHTRVNPYDTETVTLAFHARVITRRDCGPLRRLEPPKCYLIRIAPGVDGQPVFTLLRPGESPIDIDDEN